VCETVGEGERDTHRERVCKSVGERERDRGREGYFKKGCHLVFVYVYSVHESVISSSTLRKHRQRNIRSFCVSPLLSSPLLNISQSAEYLLSENMILDLKMRR
jgi:hypothetical protein